MEPREIVTLSLSVFSFLCFAAAQLSAFSVSLFCRAA